MCEIINPCSFPRSRRLLTGSAFSHVFDKPLRYKTNAFLALYRVSDSAATRLGLAVSKKKIPHAVDRNHFKRIARESFRQYEFDEIFVDIVIIAYADAQNLDNTSLFKAFYKTWSRIEQSCKN